jgi:hypothetical protein
LFSPDSADMPLLPFSYFRLIYYSLFHYFHIFRRFHDLMMIDEDIIMYCRWLRFRHDYFAPPAAAFDLFRCHYFLRFRQISFDATSFSLFSLFTFSR